MDEQPNYYRSLEQLANTPEFQAFAAEEFPGFANVYESLGEAEPKDDNPADAGLNRRKFLALSAAALGMAGLVGCRRPDIQILPFAVVPDEQVGHIVHGKPTFYATSIPRPSGALPVLVESHDGRPTKIEGNPQHPCSLGSTDAHAQASILDLYSPDRVMSDKYPGVMEGKAPRKWEDFDRFARGEAEKLAKDKGKGFYILTEQAPSPAVRALRDAIKAKLPQASWHSYEAIDTSEALKGAELAFGAKLVARYRFDKAERVLTLDCDFLGSDADSVFYSRAFAARRKTDTNKPSGKEFTVVLDIDEQGRATLEGNPATFENPVQVESFLKRNRKEEEKRRSANEGPLKAIAVLRVHNTATEKIDSLVNAAKAAAYETVEVLNATMNRLYAVESTYTVTGTMADHRLRLPASQVGVYLAAVARVEGHARG